MLTWLAASNHGNVTFLWSRKCREDIHSSHPSSLIAYLLLIASLLNVTVKDFYFSDTWSCKRSCQRGKKVQPIPILWIQTSESDKTWWFFCWWSDSSHNRSRRTSKWLFKHTHSVALLYFYCSLETVKQSTRYLLSIQFGFSRTII